MRLECDLRAARARVRHTAVASTDDGPGRASEAIRRPVSPRPMIEVPLYPYRQPDGTVTNGRRLRPQDCVNLQGLLREVAPNTVTTLDIAASPWSVINVYSPYSPDAHVMLMETSHRRVVTGPHELDANEGRLLLEVWTSILTFLAERESNASVCVGYNWSPLSWGVKEELTGFQSIPTKWHPQFWGWPSEDRFSHESPARQQEEDLFSPRWGPAFGALIKARLLAANPGIGAGFFAPPGVWTVDARGLEIGLTTATPGLFGRDAFFADVLAPIARTLEDLMRELYETVTLETWQTDRDLVKRTERRPLTPAELDRLRRTPRLRPDLHAHVKDPLLLALLSALEPSVRTRVESDGWSATTRRARGCTEDRCWETCRVPTGRCWRKGFGYALVFKLPARPASGDRGVLRIMPGVHLGPGGVVEALGVILRRPEDAGADDDAVRKRSAVLWELKRKLEDEFYRWPVLPV
jgi:hypothetical protein